MWIEIFKTGTHTDSNGNTETYSEETLDSMAEKYNSKVNENKAYEAPIVKGHPETDSPAYGWVERIARRGSTLFAKIKDVSPDFVNEIKNGMFRKISMAIYPDLLLRHVGFLGAVPPAVKGLKPVRFSDEGEYRQFKSEEDCSIINDDDEDKSGVSQTENNSSNFTENPQNDEFINKNKELEENNTTLKTQNSELRRKIDELEKEARTKSYREFANSLIENHEGSIITPAQADGLLTILEMAHSADLNKNDSCCFSEGISLVDKVKSFMQSMKPIFTTKEFALKNGSSSLQNDTDFSNKHVSAERLTLHEKAREIQSETPGLTYEGALAMALKAEKA